MYQYIRFFHGALQLCSRECTGLENHLDPHTTLSASVADWLCYLLGQWNDRGSNPGPAICLEQVCFRINLLGNHGTIQPIRADDAFKHQPTHLTCLRNSSSLSFPAYHVIHPQLEQQQYSVHRTQSIDQYFSLKSAEKNLLPCLLSGYKCDVYFETKLKKMGTANRIVTLLVGRQEGHPACKKPGVGLLVMTI